VLAMRCSASRTFVEKSITSGSKSESRKLLPH
jgi:hypothetical protein